MRLERFLILVLLGAFSIAGALQGEDKLTSGPGSTLTENKCKICHELQHIRRTPPAPDTLAAGGSDPVAKLIEAHACAGCHALESKVVGPSFRDIARRYAGDTGAAARLLAKVRAGGQGAWGQIPMPPAPAAANADLAKIVEWVLGQR